MILRDDFVSLGGFRVRLVVTVFFWLLYRGGFVFFWLGGGRFLVPLTGLGDKGLIFGWLTGLKATGAIFFARFGCWVVQTFLSPGPRVWELGSWNLGENIWGFPKMMGFPNNHDGFSLLKMIILGREMGVPPFKETPIYLIQIHPKPLVARLAIQTKKINPSLLRKFLPVEHTRVAGIMLNNSTLKPRISGQMLRNNSPAKS